MKGRVKIESGAIMDDKNNLEEQRTSEPEDLLSSEEGIDSCLAYSADGQLLLGQTLQNFSRRFGGIELDIQRDQTPAGSVDFSGPEFDRPEFEENEHDPANSKSGAEFSSALFVSSNSIDVTGIVPMSFASDRGNTSQENTDPDWNGAGSSKTS